MSCERVFFHKAYLSIRYNWLPKIVQITLLASSSSLRHYPYPVIKYKTPASVADIDNNPPEKNNCKSIPGRGDSVGSFFRDHSGPGDYRQNKHGPTAQRMMIGNP
jgi:hypothetical protein